MKHPQETMVAVGDLHICQTTSDHTMGVFNVNKGTIFTGWSHDNAWHPVLHSLNLRIGSAWIPKVSDQDSQWNGVVEPHFIHFII